MGTLGRGSAACVVSTRVYPHRNQLSQHAKVPLLAVRAQPGLAVRDLHRSHRAMNDDDDDDYDDDDEDEDDDDDDEDDRNDHQ